MIFFDRLASPGDSLQFSISGNSLSQFRNDFGNGTLLSPARIGQRSPLKTQKNSTAYSFHFRMKRMDSRLQFSNG